ncbi:DUF2474 domain-containing protein [Methylocystis sp. JR02]|uniref:DUF2474 domain-containing protein n=1 Tax=Methylocystis sp. JR02 TaxID=3046284 RepID=UPI0032D97B21
MVLLCLPRQSADWRGLSLMRALPLFRIVWVRRLGWLVALWVGSVVALAAVAMLFWTVMSLAGLTR